MKLSNVIALFGPKNLILGVLALGGAAAGYVIVSAAQPAKTPAATEVEIAGFEFARPEAAAPDAAFRDAEGRLVTLGDFEGKAVLVNFWATWCAPCVRELPSLDRLQADLGGANFQVVAVNIDSGGGRDVKQYLDDLGIANLDLYTDPRLGFAFASGVSNVVPVSILYGADGREIGRKLGPEEWDRDGVKAFLAREAGVGVSINSSAADG